MMDSGGSLLVVSGPPGSGKSTVARLLATSMDRSILVAGDEFFGFIASGGVDPWLPESDAQNAVVVDAAARATGTFVNAGYDTVYDGVIGPWYIDRFHGASAVDRLDYVVLLPPVETCVHRVRTRSAHAFSDEPAARHMHREFERDLPPEGHVLRTADATVAETVADVLAARSTGRLSWPRQPPPPVS